MYVENLGTKEVTVASPGFGAAANSFMDFVNVDEKYPTYSIPHNLHRSRDPGAGALTYHHSRLSVASRDIRQGEELFVGYGNKWFLARIHSIGPVPVEGDHDKAEKLYRTFRKKFIDQEHRRGSFRDNNHQLTGDADNLPPPPNPRLPEMAQEFWDNLVVNSSWQDSSPTMAALPPKEYYDDMLETTLIEWKKSQMSRSVEWLEENGVCADHLQIGESTIRQAGHGAFAARRLPKGKPILPIPLIHIPDRGILDMFHLIKTGNYLGHDKSQPRRPQLLLNYCLGHRDSSLLLSPYGPAFGLVNHNQTLVNARLQWASPKRSQHNPELLKKDIATLEQQDTAQLAMELVTTRDIELGEEIFLDYGDEWESAWQEHVKRWKPNLEAAAYQSAFEMNQKFNHVFRTEFEQLQEPYSNHLMLKFHRYFSDKKFRQRWIERHPNPLQEESPDWKERKSVECDVLRREWVGNRILYTIVIGEDSDSSKDKNKWKILEKVPQEAIFFQDQPYSTDTFLENAFRHDIRIPDDLFPETWKNLKQQQK